MHTLASSGIVPSKFCLLSTAESALHQGTYVSDFHFVMLPGRYSSVFVFGLNATYCTRGGSDAYTVVRGVIHFHTVLYWLSGCNF